MTATPEPNSPTDAIEALGPFLSHTTDCAYQRFDKRDDICRCGLAKAMEQARAMQAPPEGDDALREAVKPFANYDGDLPDYDDPLRPVYESGIQYAVELLAKELGVEDYDICGGTEEFDGDLGGTLLNIVIKTWPTDEHGDWLDLRDPNVRAALARADAPKVESGK